MVLRVRLEVSTILGDYRHSLPLVLPTGTIIQIVKERVALRATGDLAVGEVGFRFPLGCASYALVDSLSSGFRITLQSVSSGLDRMWLYQWSVLRP